MLSHPTSTSSTPAVKIDRPAGSGYAAAGIIASVLGAASALLLCVALVAAALGHEPLPWSHGRHGLTVALIGVWLVAALGGVFCGVIALLLHYPGRTWPVLVAALGGVSLLVVPASSLAALGIWAHPHPSDSAMIAELQQHRPQFDQAMAGLRTAGHVDRKPLRAAGVKVQDVGSSGSAVLLTVNSWGIVPSGWEKGYAYSRKPLGPLTTGNTQSYGEPMPDDFVFRHVSGPWYIYYESW